VLTLFSDVRIDYDGSQLRSGWLAERFGLTPDAEGVMAAFLGGCDVKPEFVVDLEEVASGEPIRAALMLHFIAEFPELDLEKAVLRQRLLASTVRDELAARATMASTAEGAERAEDNSSVAVPKAQCPKPKACLVPSSAFSASSAVKNPVIVRRGDDLYDGEFKLSVSIATLSPKSALIHFAVDVDPTGAPVPARGLGHYGVDPRELAEAVLSAYAAETSGVRRATGKVRPVK
jgi:uncharacterized protein